MTFPSTTCPRPESGRKETLFLVGIVSAALLAYELLLTRIMAVQYWSYFASMIISLAMLGFAVSGTLLFLAAGTKNGAGFFLPWAIALFIVSLPLSARLSQEIECIPLMILWDATQLGAFAANYLVLSLPFCCGGYILGCFFLSEKADAGHVYFANMLGSGAGVLIALLFLCEVRPVYALSMTGFPVVVAAWFVFRGRSHRSLFLAAMVLLPLPSFFVSDPPLISQYKGMSNLLLVPDARIEHSSWNRYGYMTVMDSSTIRYAPGLSLTYGKSIPDQKAVFMNGGSREVVCGWERTDLFKDYFESMIGAGSYLFHDKPRVIIAGSGGGMDALSALMHGASRVDALENNTAMAQVMTGPLAEFSGGLYADKKVNLLIAGARPYANRTTNVYDVAVIPAKGSLFASAAGTSAQDPDYLLTKQSLWDFFSLLSPDGVIAIETWINLPPRHAAKIFSTAAAMLREHSLNPSEHLLAARSLRTGLLLISRSPVGKERVNSFAEFCDKLSFDRIYHQGITSDAANKFNRVEGAPYHNLFTRIIDNPADASKTHLFRIDPVSDDSPYFSHFFQVEGST